MNFLDFEYFNAIVKAGNISTAAKDLFVSQQSLSERIARLEKEIGAALFFRGRQITLTPVGKRFQEYSKAALAAQKTMFADLQQLIKTKNTTISVGVHTFEPPPFLTLQLIRFSQRFPQYEVKVHPLQNIYTDNPVLYDMDLILWDTDGETSDELDARWETEPLSYNNKFAVVARKSLLLETYGDQWPAIEKKLIATRDISLVGALPFVSVRNEHNLYYRMQRRIFASSGIEPKIKFQVDMNYLNNEMCINGVAAYIGPEGLCSYKLKSFQKGSDDKEAFCLYKIEVPDVYHGLNISYRKESGCSQIERGFIDLCKALV